MFPGLGVQHPFSKAACNCSFETPFSIASLSGPMIAQEGIDKSLKDKRAAPAKSLGSNIEKD